jgi:hypothetical protein
MEPSAGHSLTIKRKPIFRYPSRRGPSRGAEPPNEIKNASWVQVRRTPCTALLSTCFFPGQGGEKKLNRPTDPIDPNKRVINLPGIEKETFFIDNRIHIAALFILLALEVGYEKNFFRRSPNL